MKRRDLIKQLGLSTGIVLSLPTWAKAWSGEDLQKSGLFNTKENDLLSVVAGTFIPEGDKEPGAVGLEVDKFLDRLFADCYSQEDQLKIKVGLERLTNQAKVSFGKDFKSCSKSQREALLANLASPGNPENEWFYNTLRRETIRGYTTSEYVMLNHYNYVMAPGFYDGCVDINS